MMMMIMLVIMLFFDNWFSVSDDDDDEHDVGFRSLHANQVQPHDHGQSAWDLTISCADVACTSSLRDVPD